MLTELTDNLDVIAALDDEPNDTGGLTAAQLKAKFDEAGNAIKEYLNDTHLPEHTAENTVFTPITGVTSTNTQDAIEEVYTAGQAVTLGQIPDGSITADKLSSGAVTESKIGDIAVTAQKLGLDVTAILAEKLEADIGTYTGTGTFGSVFPNSIVLSAPPKLILVHSATVPVFALFLYGTSHVLQLGSTAGGLAPASSLTTTWNGNTLSWYGGNDFQQLNRDGEVYRYLALR